MGGGILWYLQTSQPRNGARVGILTKEGLLSALKELGLAAIGNAEEAPTYKTCGPLDRLLQQTCFLFRP